MPLTFGAQTFGTQDTWSLWNTTTSSTNDVYELLGNITPSAATTWTQWNLVAQGAPQGLGGMGQSLAGLGGSLSGITQATLHQETPEERATRERQTAEREAARVAAEEKAEVLLREALTAEQTATLIRERYFDVIGSRGRRYRIRRGSAGNVYQFDGEGRRLVKKLCCHPVDVPDADAMLAQKLMLATDEDGFLRIANEHPFAAVAA